MNNCCVSDNNNLDAFSLINDNSTWDYRSNYYMQLKSAVGVWICLVAVVGCPANLFAARCAWKFARTRNPTQLYQWFVFSMSMADFLFLLIVATLQFSQYSLRVRLSRLPCSIMYIVSHCTTVASSLSLLSLNVDKFLAIYRPLYHVSILSGRRVLAVVSISWLVSVGWSFSFIFGPYTSYRDHCLWDVTSLEYYLSFAVVFFFAPTAAATALSVAIAIVVKRQLLNANSSGRRSLADIGVIQEEHSFDGPHFIALRRNSRSLLSTANAVHRDSLIHARKITFVFTTTIWSCLTYLPYRIAYAVHLTMRQFSVDRSAWFTILALLSFALMNANPAGNPIITIFTQRRFREELKSTWKKVCNFILARKRRYRNCSNVELISEDQRKYDVHKNNANTNARIPLLN